MKKSYLVFPKVVCYALFSASLAWDIVEVARGNVDVNRHLPFFYPFLFAIYALIIIFLERCEAARGDRHIR